MKRIDEVCEVLRAAQSLIILCHKSPDGDALGSALALSSVLKEAGKKAAVVSADPVPRIYRFLELTDEVITPEQVTWPYDTVVLVDMNDLSRSGRAEALYSADKKLCIIDHHQYAVSPEHPAYIVTQYGACAMAILDVIKQCGYPLNEVVAKLLYTGLSTDTGHFAYSNTKSETMEVAAELLSYISQPHKIYEALYGYYSQAHAFLMRDVLNNMVLCDGGRIAYSTLSSEELKRANTTPGDTDGLINVLRSIEGVCACFLVREEENGKRSVSMRSNESVDAERVMRAIGGGGHKCAAGATVEEKTNDILIYEILEQIRINWNKK